MTFLIFLVVASLIAYRAIPKDTSAQLPRLVLTYVAAVRHYGGAETEAFYEALTARTRRVIAASALALASLLAYKLVPFASLASVGPRTTNGEWWRLVTAMFAYSNALQLVISLAAFVQLSNVLERLVGRLAFVTAFTASGVLAGLVPLSSHPLQPASSASSAIAGLYGLMLVSFVAGRLHRSNVTVPIVVLKRMAPLAAAFAIASADHAWNVTADLAGLVVGMAVGVFVAHDVSEGHPSTRLVMMACGATLIFTVAAAIPLRGILDVKPELEHVVALERTTAQTYETAAARVRAGAMTGDALATLIANSIVPALRAEDDRLAALKHVPEENQPSIADARRYLRLRIDSWTLRMQSLHEPSGPPDSIRVADGDSAAAFRARAQARHRASGLTRGRVEAAEHEALEAFARLGPAS